MTDVVERVRGQQHEISQLAGCDRSESLVLLIAMALFLVAACRAAAGDKPDSTSISNSWCSEKPGRTFGSGESVPTSSGTPARCSLPVSS